MVRKLLLKDIKIMIIQGKQLFYYTNVFVIKIRVPWINILYIHYILDVLCILYMFYNKE